MIRPVASKSGNISGGPANTSRREKSELVISSVPSLSSQTFQACHLERSKLVISSACERSLVAALCRDDRVLELDVSAPVTSRDQNQSYRTAQACHLERSKFVISNACERSLVATLCRYDRVLEFDVSAPSLSSRTPQACHLERM